MTNDFESLAMKYEKNLYAQAVKRLADPMEAQDAVQETLLKAWLHFDQLRDCPYTGAWLMRVLINECISMQRRKQSRQKLFQAAARAGWEHTVFDETLIRWIDIENAMDQIGENKRALLIQFWFSGHSIGKIARLAGESRPAVYAKIDRGRKKLRTMLAG